MPVDTAGDDQIWTPLHWATQRSHLAMVRRHGARPPGSLSILRIGAQVELLLEHGAPISPKDSNGFEPVQYAAYTGGLDILKKLLSVGAVTRPPGSQSCVDLARGQGHAEEKLLHRY